MQTGTGIMTLKQCDFDKKTQARIMNTLVLTVGKDSYVYDICDACIPELQRLIDKGEQRVRWDAVSDEIGRLQNDLTSAQKRARAAEAAAALAALPSASEPLKRVVGLDGAIVYTDGKPLLHEYDEDLPSTSAEKKLEIHKADCTLNMAMNHPNGPCTCECFDEEDAASAEVEALRKFVVEADELRRWVAGGDGLLGTLSIFRITTKFDAARAELERAEVAE